MTNEEHNAALYQKMFAEQESFRDWLKNQPSEEILNHAYEYTIREDILLSLEYHNLSDAQIDALMESPSPLADVFRDFERLETDHMDTVWDCMENRADIPLWPIPRARARPTTSGWGIRRSLPTANRFAMLLTKLWHRNPRALMNCWNFCVNPGIRLKTVKYPLCWELTRSVLSAWILWARTTPRMPSVPLSPGLGAIPRKRNAAWKFPPSPAAVC